MRGRAEIGFGRDGDRDRLHHLYQQAPLRVLFPDPPDGEPPLAAIVTTSGGLVGGDRLDLSFQVGAGARGIAMAQAAEKVYRSLGPTVDMRVDIHVGPDAWAEYLPQETILFDDARLRRRTCLHLDRRARVLAGEILVFGRTARGERFTNGLARDSWEVRQDGRLIWADALHVDDDIETVMASAAGFGGAVACATLVLAGPDAARHLDGARAVLADGGRRGGVGMIGPLLVARWLDGDAWALRSSFAALWCHLRGEHGLRAQMPRLWHV